MSLYVFLLILCAGGCIWAGRDKLRQQSVAWFVLAAMLLLCGLRGDTVGTDTFNYLSPFSSSKQIGRTSELLFYLTYRLVPFPHLWLFLTACLIYVPLFGIVKKETYYAAVAVLIYMSSVTKIFPNRSILSDSPLPHLLFWPVSSIGPQNGKSAVCYFC